MCHIKVRHQLFSLGMRRMWVLRTWYCESTLWVVNQVITPTSWTVEHRRRGLSSNGTWTNVSSDFTNQWNTWVGTGKQWTLNLNALETNWSGTGDYTYTTPSGNNVIRIYNVVINPTLADSLFQPNT